MPAHLYVIYRLPDGHLITHRFHYLSTDTDGMTTWQVDPENEPIDVYKATFVRMEMGEQDA